MRSQSFFDNEPKQILSAIPDLSAKNKQTVAPSIRGTATTTKQPLLLRFLIIQSTFPYMCPTSQLWFMYSMAKQTLRSSVDA